MLSGYSASITHSNRFNKKNNNESVDVRGVMDEKERKREIFDNDDDCMNRTQVLIKKLEIHIIFYSMM